MSASIEQIVCRRCSEEFPTADENCPHCGTPVRGYKGPTVLILLGLVLVGASVPNLGDMVYYAAIGVVLVVIGGYVIKDKRDRIKEAEQY